MLKLLGAVLVIAGTTLYSVRYIETMQNKINNTSYVKYIMDLLVSEIRYKKAALPDACILASYKVKEPYADAFAKVSNRMKTNEGISFEQIWKEEIEECLAKLELDQREKDLFLGFATRTGYSEDYMQIHAWEECVEQLEQSISRQEKELDSKRKVALGLGVVSGIFITIILL